MANDVQFPDCCGFIVINGFRGGHPGSDPEACVSVTECKAYLKKVEQNYYNKRGGLLAVLSKPQEERIGKVFLERKWKLLLNNHLNPRTGVPLFMYFRDLNDKPLRKKRIFGD